MIKRWILGVLAGILFSMLAIYPQYRIYQVRGTEYNGAFASCDLDEMAYASYMQALIDGRPRKNDPYTGRDANSDHPESESLFSIQFFPSYAAAGVTWVLGLSASEGMPVVSVLSAFAAALALYWLILSITGNELIAFAGALVVMIFAAFMVGIGAINGYLEGGVAYPFFPMLRRPIPSLASPVLFAFFACLWNGLHALKRFSRNLYMVLAAVCFACLVFSYFYLWTAAAAVLAAFVLLIAIFPYENRKHDLAFLLTTALLCTASLAPYAWLLAGRNKMADKAQLLVFTHRPDFSRGIETLGLMIAALAVLAAVFRLARINDRKLQFVAAMAISPLIVFNQQIFTGHSLQPFHYEFYVINYVVLLGLVLLVGILLARPILQFRTATFAALMTVVAASLIWGYIETTQTTEFWDDTNVRRDEAMPVNLRLRQLADSIDSGRSQTTLNLEALQADSQPTVAPQPVLWARHQHTFSGISSWEENKRRYYQLLYYSDLDGRWLKRALTGCDDIEACMALFGWDRFNPRLSSAAHPLTNAEIDAEAENFEQFVLSYSSEDAKEPSLAYAIAYSASPNRFENLDRWYSRDEGEQVGNYTLYRLQLRSLEQ